MPWSRGYEEDRRFRVSLGGSIAAAVAFILLLGMIVVPLELRELFREWLQSEFPDRAAHVLSLMKSMREGKDYDPTFGKRMKGVGPYAWSIGRRFEVMAKRLGLNEFKRELRTDLFERPAQPGDQLSLL